MKQERADAPSVGEQRRSPLVAQAILFAVFLVFVTVGVFTVVIPELTSDDAEPSEDTGAVDESAGDDDEEADAE